MYGPYSMGLLFIDKFIFLVKKMFLTKFQKLASERNFDLEPSIDKEETPRQNSQFFSEIIIKN